MPSNDDDISRPLQTSLGYQLTVFFGLSTQCHFRGHPRPDRREYDALRVASLALSGPLTNETIVVASDIDGCGRGLIVN